MNELFEIVKNIIYQGLEAYGRYYSEYRAVVINNDDPEGLQRIRVVIPEITGINTAYSQWVYPKNRFYGDDYGIHIVPRKNDMVLITFEKGDKNAPLYSFSPTQKSKQVDSNLLGNKIWLKTPSSCMILIDDDLGDLSISNSKNIKMSIRGNTLFIGKNYSTSEPLIKGSSFINLYKSMLQDNINLYNEANVQLTAQAAILNGIAPGSGVPLNTLALSFANASAQALSNLSQADSTLSNITYTE